MHVQAMGVVSESGQAQVSMNLLDYEATSLARVVDMVRMEAARYVVEIADSEVVGLIPLDAVAAVAREYLHLKNFRREQILEARLIE